MKLFSRLFSSSRSENLSTRLERQRFNQSMPGQTAAIAAARLGCLVM